MGTYFHFFLLPSYFLLSAKPFVREALVSRATFFRWVKDGQIPDTEYRDRNGRRCSRLKKEQLKQFAHRLVEGPQLRFPITRAR